MVPWHPPAPRLFVFVTFGGANYFFNRLYWSKLYFVSIRMFALCHSKNKNKTCRVYVRYPVTFLWHIKRSWILLLYLSNANSNKQPGGLNINHSYLSGPIVSVSFLMDYLPEVDLAFFFIYLYASWMNYCSTLLGSHPPAKLTLLRYGLLIKCSG